MRNFSFLTMKKLLIAILLSHTFFNTYTQEYIEFPKENAAWDYSFGLPEHYDWRYRSVDLYCIKGDTMINNLNYQIINNLSYITKSVYQSSDEILSISNQEALYFIREENKRIYFRFGEEHHNYLEYPEEYVVYDFNLALNDTFITYRNDTLAVYMEDDNGFGEGRKALYLQTVGFDWHYFTEVWYEGIGNIKSSFIQGLGYDRSFFRRLTNNSCEACSCIKDIITSNSPIQPPGFLSLFPNPASDLIRLELEEANNIIQILNMQGQEVYQTQIADKNPTIPIHNLSKGVYFIVVTNKNGKVSQGKFIKQ